MTDRDRLIELFNAIEKDPAITCPAYKTDKTCKECKYTINESMCNHIERTVDYLLANGVIVPPCKVGTEIFGVFDNDDEQRKEIYEGKVLCYSLDENNLLWARMRYKNGLTYWHTIDDFGKTVFLTKEEAEQALKEIENG